MEEIKIPVSAVVKGNELDCYGWLPEEKLLILKKVYDLDAKHGQYLYMAYNVDRECYGGISTGQFIPIGSMTLLDIESSEFGDEYTLLGCSGNKIVGLKKKDY